MSLIATVKKFAAKKFLWNVGYVYLGSLMNGVSLFAINVILGRGLEKADYAIFTLVTLVLSTVAEMSDFGLNAGLLRFGPYYRATNQTDKLKQLVKIIWQWRTSLSVILTVGGMAASPLIARYIFGQPHLTSEIAFSFLGVGGIILLGFLATYLQAEQRFVYNATLQSLKGLLRLAFIGGLVLWGNTNLYAYVSAYVLVPWVLFLVNYHVLPAKFTSVSIDSEVKQKMNEQLKKFSFWLTVASLTSIVASRIDQVMVSRFLGLEQVAIYTVAYQFIQLYPILWQSISSVLTPKLSSVTTKAEVVALVRRTLKWIVPLLVCIAVLIYPSQYLIVLLFGHKYDAAMSVYLVLSYGIVFNLLAIPFSLIMGVFNKTNLTAFSGVLQLVTNVALNFWLIPIYGVMGAAYTFSFSIIVSLVYSVSCAIYLFKKKELNVV